MLGSKDEEKATQEAIARAMDYVYKGGKKLGSGMKANDMIEPEAGQKLLEYGQEKQKKAKKVMWH